MRGHQHGDPCPIAAPNGGNVCCPAADESTTLRAELQLRLHRGASKALPGCWGWSARSPCRGPNGQALGGCREHPVSNPDVVSNSCGRASGSARWRRPSSPDAAVTEGDRTLRVAECRCCPAARRRPAPGDAGHPRHRHPPRPLPRPAQDPPVTQRRRRGKPDRLDAPWTGRPLDRTRTTHLQRLDPTVSA